MKYSDIKPLSSNGHYTVDIPLDMLKDNIDRYIEGYGLDMDPDFQRGYVWTEEQKEKYVEFILREGKTANVLYFNHPYWMSICEKGHMILLDGKQRLSSLLGFVNNEVKAFGVYYKDFEGKFPMRIGIKINVNNMKSRADILQWYIDFNSGGTVHPKEEIDKVKELLRQELEGD